MTARLRVMRIIARMNVGGPALQAVGLQQGLDPDRFESRLVAGDVGPGEADYLELRAPNLDVVRIPGLGRAPNPAGDVRALAALRREIRDFRPHVVHTHTAKAGTLGRLAALSTGRPAIVHTFHGHLLHGYFSPLATRGIVQAERLLARISTRLVAVGERVLNELLAAGIGSPDQYRVVPPGVPAPEPMPRDTARAELGLAPDADVVVFTGRITGVKRPDRLVAAFREIAARRPHAVLLVAGGGALAERLRADVADLGPRVRLLGWRADLGRIYAASDVVLLASDNEGMPVSLIEAAHAGRPAVTTNVGSAAEVVVDGVTGFVTSTSVGKLATAVERLLADEAMRERMGSAASERAASEYGAARLVADTEQLYEEIAIEKGLP